MSAHSPMDWLHLLTGRLLADQPRMVLMRRYYRGEHPLPFVPRDLQVAYREMLQRSKSNYMRMVAKAPAQRLKVQGFRRAGSLSADAGAWGRWVGSGMEAQSPMSILDSLICGRSFLSVWRDQGADAATIRAEDPLSTLLAYDSRSRKRIAGLRLTTDEWTGGTSADVWLPDGCYRFHTPRSSIAKSVSWPQSWSPGGPINAQLVASFSMSSAESAVAFEQWQNQWTEVEFIPAQLPGVIPVVEVTNSPSLTRWPDGESEFEDVTPTQDRINEMLFNRALAAWTTAFRQKWATGLELPVDEHGNPVEPFKAAIDRLWVSEDERTKFGSFEATDLSPFIDSIEQDVQSISVQKQIPRHYFMQQGQDPSGDAMRSAEGGLVANVEDKQQVIGAAHAELNRIADELEGVSAGPVSTVWANPRTYGEGEIADSVAKLVTAGLIPLRTGQERLGYSPAEIEQMDALFAQERLMSEAMSLLAPEVEA